MAEGARVESIDVLKELKIALWKFQEAATVALGDAESEMGRLLMWLQTEQDSFWQHQIRKCEETVTRCKEAVRMKKVFKDASGRDQTAIEEEKALKIALARMEEARQKLNATRRWARVLPKEIEMYKGGVQRFATTVQSDLPAACAHLERLAGKLDAYLAVQAAMAAGPVGAAADGAGGSGEASMGRRGAGAAAPDGLEEMLTRIPDHATRAATAVVSQVRLPVPTIPPDHQTPAMLPVTPRTAPKPEARIFVAISTAQAVRLFAHRHPEPQTAEDSGWSIAPAEGGPELQWEAITAADFLKIRPDFADLLGLPKGFSAIIDSSGVSDVIDAKRQPAWRRST